MVLLVEHPVLLFQFYCCLVLLVCSLLIVKGKEESVKIKLAEVLFAVEHGHSWEHVVLLEGYWMLSLLELLILRLRYVPVRGL